MRPPKNSRNPFVRPGPEPVQSRVKLNYFNDQGLERGREREGEGVALACITSGHTRTSYRSCWSCSVLFHCWCVCGRGLTPRNSGGNEHPVITLSDIRVGFPLFSAGLT